MLATSPTFQLLLPQKLFVSRCIHLSFQDFATGGILSGTPQRWTCCGKLDVTMGLRSESSHWAAATRETFCTPFGANKALVSSRFENASRDPNLFYTFQLPIDLTASLLAIMSLLSLVSKSIHVHDLGLKGLSSTQCLAVHSTHGFE